MVLPHLGHFARLPAHSGFDLRTALQLLHVISVAGSAVIVQFDRSPPPNCRRCFSFCSVTGCPSETLTYQHTPNGGQNNQKKGRRVLPKPNGGLGGRLFIGNTTLSNPTYPRALGHFQSVSVAANLRWTFRLQARYTRDR